MFLGESSDAVEIQLHGVWLAGVRGADVAYWARKKCKTKVDEETGCCKKQSTHGCATEQEDTRQFLPQCTWLIGQAICWSMKRPCAS